MAKIKTEYVGDLRCKVVESPGKTGLTTDGPKSIRGLEEEMSPTDLLGASLGACILTMMGMQAGMQKADISGAFVEIEKSMTADNKRLGKIVIDVHGPGGLEDKVRERLEKAAYNCPVHHSLHPDIEQVMTFHWDL